MKALPIALAGALSIFGCMGQVFAADASKVVDATEAQVVHCTFLQDVSGRSVFGERLKEQGVAKAKEAARAQAASAGATDIVWGQISSTDVTTAAGKAYRCSS